jgi:hypothetical protein
MTRKHLSGWWENFFHAKGYARMVGKRKILHQKHSRIISESKDGRNISPDLEASDAGEPSSVNKTEKYYRSSIFYPRPIKLFNQNDFSLKPA